MDPKEYLETQVMGADPIELVRILYRGAINSIEDARGYLKSGDILARGNSISRAMDFLSELTLSLDMENGGEVSQRLAGLYAYVQRAIFKAHAERSDAPLAESSKLLNTLLEGWDGLKATPESTSAGNLAPEPELQETSPVFASPYGGSYASSGAGRSWEL